MWLFDFLKKLFKRKKNKKERIRKKKLSKKINKKIKNRKRKNEKKTPKIVQKKKRRREIHSKIKKKVFQKKIKKASKYKKEHKQKEVEIGIITHYFGKISVGIIKLKKPLKLGDKIHIKGAHDDFIQTIESMQINHKDVNLARAGKEVGIKVIQRVHENDKVYKITQ
jgi:putative protease